MKKIIVFIALISIIIISVIALTQETDESSFKPEIASSPFAKKIYSYIEKHKEKIIKEWIHLTEIPAPSGHEAKRAQYMKKQYEAAGLDETYIDEFGNAIGIWKGDKKGKKIIFAAHMDTVFQDVWDIKVKREGNLLKAPGIEDDTASCIIILWVIRALKHAGFKPVNDYYFIGTVGEEVGLKGMRHYLDNTQEKIDMLIALDGDIGWLFYGCVGSVGGKIIFRGPGAHTMFSHGVPHPNVALAKVVERIYQIPVILEPLDKWTIYNIGVIQGGKVSNAVPQEAFFTLDLRSANQSELEKVAQKIEEISQEVADEVGVEVELKLNKGKEAIQLPNARHSPLVRTAEDILSFLQVKDQWITPLGSTDANAGIERGIPSINLGCTKGRYLHTLREEAEIDPLFTGIKQVILMILSLD